LGTSWGRKGQKKRKFKGRREKGETEGKKKKKRGLKRKNGRVES